MTNFYRTSPIDEKGKPLAVAFLSFILLSQVACGSNDNAHTTATTVVPPPPRQALIAVTLPSPKVEKAGSPVRATSPSTLEKEYVGVDPDRPLLTFNLENKNTFRVGEVVPVYFSVLNAKLRSEGGDYRVRYIIDDEDPRWLDRPEPFGLSGWVPGTHIIRLELIGPDGWPYRNGNQNIVTLEITVVSQ